MKELKTRIQHKHDTASKWAVVESTFVPLAGELIVYDVDDTHNYPRFKIGDGNTKLEELPFTIPEDLYDAEENQNAFSYVQVGNAKLEADDKQDTLNLAEGGGIGLTLDTSTDKITIANSGVRGVSQGTTDGTISVDTNGTAVDVAVKGLKSAAFTDKNDYATSGHTHNYAGSDSADGPANSVKSSLTVGGKTYNGSADVTITAADLGLAQAMSFIGSADDVSNIFDGSTTSTIHMNGASVEAEAGDVVLFGGYEYVWTGTIWEQLGQEGSFALIGHKHAITDVTTLQDELDDRVLKEQRLDKDTDLNTVTTTGFYKLSSSHTNAPPYAYADGQLIVGRGFGDTLTQMIFPYSSSRMYIRTAQDVDSPGKTPTWNTWVEVLTNRTITATATELNYVEGVTSNIQDQLNHRIRDNNTIGGTNKTVDLNTITTTGFYRLSSADNAKYTNGWKEPCGGGQLIVSYNGSGDTLIQLGFSYPRTNIYDTVPHMFVRTCRWFGKEYEDGSDKTYWTPWAEVIFNNNINKDLIFENTVGYTDIADNEASDARRTYINSRRLSFQHGPSSSVAMSFYKPNTKDATTGKDTDDQFKTGTPVASFGDYYLKDSGGHQYAYITSTQYAENGTRIVGYDNPDFKVTDNGYAAARVGLKEGNTKLVDKYVRKTVAPSATAENKLDLNTITESGFYRLTDNEYMTNHPATPYGQLIVSRGHDTITQMAFPFSQSTMFIRTASGIGANSDWHPWVRVITSDLVDDYTGITKDATSGAFSFNGTATKATQDGSGNTITSTYATKTEVNAKVNTSTYNAHKHSVTAKGTVSQPTFTGTAASHNHSFTGTEAGHTHTFNGTAAEHNHTFTGTEHTHTFKGSAVTSGDASATQSIYQITGVGTAASHSYTAPSLTGSVTNQCLTLTWSAGSHSFTANTVPTRSAVTVALAHTHSVTAAGTVSGTTAGGTVNNKSVTPAGTIAETKITPAGTVDSKSITPAGTVSQPTFTGTAVDTGTPK